MVGKKSKLTVAAILVGLFLALAAAGCGTAENSKTAWEVIKEKGVLTVGTSADYPPFEFVDEKGQYTGFDIELIKAVGEKLGVEVKIEDMAFDTLISALPLGKIDAVIACMSPTPDRLKEADFSDPYYKTVNAILAKKGAAVTVVQPADVANYRIGVQTGTTHDEWVTKNLLETAKLDEKKYFRYQRVDQGIMDLLNGQIDVFITDLPPAQEFLATKPLQMAFQGELNPNENPGIAVAKGNQELLAAINQAIKELQDEKVIETLAAQYLTETK